MKLAILGYGLEGKSVEKYFKSHPYDNIPPDQIEITVFKEFAPDKIGELGLEEFDVIFRSPSVYPNYNFKQHDDDTGESTFHKYEQDSGPYWTSATEYFLRHCPTEDVITVTGTKGKGTTCSMIKALIESLPFSHKVFLVGNIGVPALDVLDKITDLDTVIFEISSFQLWDLHLGTYTSLLLRIEPDHLNIHKDYDDYLYAKSAVARYKTKYGHLIYYKDSAETTKIANASLAKKYTYPIDKAKLLPEARENLAEILDCLKVPGAHNRENAEAAILGATISRVQDLNIALTDQVFVESYKKAFKKFRGLPHRCEFLRELNGIRYYNDNYCTALPSLDVALNAFPGQNIVLIAGGRSKGTDDQIAKRIIAAKNVRHLIVIGEVADNLIAEVQKSSLVSSPSNPLACEKATDLQDAVAKARAAAEKINQSSPDQTIVLMSPGFASFDMFKNATDRGENFTALVNDLK